MMAHVFFCQMFKRYFKSYLLNLEWKFWLSLYAGSQLEGGIIKIWHLPLATTYYQVGIFFGNAFVLQPYLPLKLWLNKFLGPCGL